MIATTEGRTIVVRSELLGEFDVSEDQLITFTRGLPGFPEGNRYALMPTGRDGVFWLQSLDFTALSFLLVDPFQFFPGTYFLDLTPEDQARIGTTEPAELLVLSIVTLGAHPGQSATANLRAPLLVNLRSRSAFQSIRADGNFGVREPLESAALDGANQDA
jgi:flagellar assembly factor FliW